MRVSGLLTFGLLGVAHAAPQILTVGDVIQKEIDQRTRVLLDGLEAMREGAANAGLAPQDGTTLGKFMGDFNKAFGNFDKAIAGITKENVATQMDQVSAAGKKMNEVSLQYAPKIKSSGEVAILSALSLITPLTNMLKTLNSTYQHINEKRPIIMEAHQEEKIKASLDEGKKGITAIFEALPTQIPKSLLSSIESSTGKKIEMPTADKIAPIVDIVVDTIYKVSLYRYCPTPGH
jgi:hypothetical protein